MSCKKTIEKATKKKGVVKSDWNKDSKLLIIRYNRKILNEDDILKSLAYAGYDNEKYLAPTDAYSKLPDCCRYERTGIPGIQSQNNPHTNHSQKKDNKDTLKKRHQLENVYNSYFELKDALIQSDGKKASLQAKKLTIELDKIDMHALQKKDHDSYMLYLDHLNNDAQKISEIENVEKQREIFDELSDNMYALMKAIKPSYTVYQINCPMFNSGKGANWISKEQTIKNPYFGQKMLTCGKVKETIK
jgi:hypothetical protein